MVMAVGLIWLARLDRGVRRTTTTIAAPAKAKVPVRRAVERKAVRPAAATSADELGSIALDTPTKRGRPAAAPAVRRATAPAIH